MQAENRFFRLVKNGLWVILGVIVLLGLVMYSQGAVMVYVHEKKPSGPPIFLPIPALAVTAGMGFIRAKQLQGRSGELHQWLPAIRAAGRELAHSPDGLLLEVKEAREHVLIAKHRDHLMINVDSDDETVRLSLPIETIQALADHLMEDQPTI